MLKRSKLNSIKRAARRGDWSVVGAIYLDLCVEAESDKLRLESLAPYVRLRDPEQLIQVVDEAFGTDTGDGS